MTTTQEPDEEPPPPPYDGSTPHHQPFRLPPFSRPDSVTSHGITLEPFATPQAFPYPEPARLWLSRDVPREDWAIFVADLVAIPRDTIPEKTDALGPKGGGNTPHEKGANGEVALQRMYEVLARWNAGFFEPRGLTIIAAGESETKGKGSKWQFGPNRFGVQIGGALLGLDISPLSKSSSKS